MKLPKNQCSHIRWKGSKLKELLETIWRHHSLQDRIKRHREIDVLASGSQRWSTKFVIQGLTWTSESYEEVIRCLKEWYDCPSLVQGEHIHSIVDAIHVKNGSDKELHHLYDAATQH